jgi:mannosyltransferase OCH1-like enzyme
MQTWKSLEVPKNWLLATQSLQNSLPERYKYIFLTDDELDDFVAVNFPELFMLFKMLPYPIQRADVGRYLWLFKFGGLYIDMDYLILKPFIQYLETLKADLILVHSSNMPIVLTNSFIMARPGLRELYDLAKESLLEPFGSWWAFSKHIHIMSSTGPLAFHKKVISSEMSYVSLPNKLFLNTSPVRLDKQSDFHGGFMIPVEGASWNSVDTIILNFFNSFKWNLLFLVFALIVYALLDFSLMKLNLNFLLGNLKRSIKLNFNKPQKLNTIKEELKRILTEAD